MDSAYPPSVAQVAAARAAGYSGWNGYFAGLNILHGWSDADFRTVLDGGLSTLAFCSGWSNPTAALIRGQALGIPIMVDCEGGIRGDGPWLQPWLDASGAGLYANYWVFGGKRASRYMLCAYPTSGDPGGASWSSGYVARPAGLCGWQWAGSHNEFGVTVDSEWLDNDFYGKMADDVRLIRNPAGVIATYDEGGKRAVSPDEWGLLGSAPPNGYGDTYRDINQIQWDAIPDAAQVPEIAPVLDAIKAMRADLDAAAGDLATIKRLVMKDLAP